MKRLYKNWPFHNLIAHPISEIAYWIWRPFGKDKATDIAGKIHDMSLPEKPEEDGRG